MYVLGINGSFGRSTQDPSVYLYQDGKLLYGCEEERFNRIRYSSGMLPELAIENCLDYCNILIDDIDYVAFPQRTWGQFFTDRLTTFFQTRFGYCPKLRFYDHHAAHAASTYYNSSYEDALIITADGTGDGISTAIDVAKNGEITRIKEISFPNSLGHYYSTLTQFLGYRRNSDEYKVMGLSAYGENKYDFSQVLQMKDDAYILNPHILSEVTEKLRYPLHITKQDICFNNRINELYGGRNRLMNEPISQFHMDIASSVQKQLEQVVTSLVQYYIEKTRLHNICLAGGTFMNCLLNGKIYEMCQVESLYVPPVADDSGTAMGAAILCMKEEGYQIEPISNAYYGEEFSDDKILKELQRCKVSYQYLGDAIYEHVANELAQGKVIGWFQGRMEIGARALGNRSILANPNFKGMKKKVNDLKRRMNYQPFAPSVLCEQKNNYFYMDKICSDMYMTITVRAREEKREQIAEVVHVDGTCRVQSVSKESNERYHRLIEKFYEISGCPVVLNTSLNRKGEPICRTINDVLADFYSTELDGIAIGAYYVSKS